MGLDPKSRARFNLKDASVLLLDAPTQDISSSGIRERLSRGLAVAGMIPAAVETHIRKHHLYTAQPHAGARVARADDLHGQD